MPQVASGRRDYEWTDEFPRGEWWHEDVPKMLEQLSPRQWTYIAARVRGDTKNAAAGKAHSTAATTSKWEQAPWWEAAAQKERRLVFGDKQEQLTPIISEALQRIKDEIAGRHGDDLAHASAVYVLDQAWGKAQSNIKQETTGDGAVGSTIVEVLRALSVQRRAQLDGPQTSVVEALPPPEDSPPESASFVPNPEV